MIFCEGGGPCEFRVSCPKHAKEKGIFDKHCIAFPSKQQQELKRKLPTAVFNETWMCNKEIHFLRFLLVQNFVNNHYY